MLNDSTNIFITGVTGLIGGELLRRLIRCDVGQIFCLIRPTPDQTARDRLIKRLQRSEDVRLLKKSTRLEAVSGDVTHPMFGLSKEDVDRVTQSVNLIIHCASELSFIKEFSCRQTNVVGMQNLIELVRCCRHNPLVVHISTATICGTFRDRVVTEDGADDPNNDHHNEYTRSKAVAERVLRGSGLPSLVVRPSIVLSADLPIEQFARAILWFLPLLNEFDAVPVDPASRVDVVPVWFVVDSVIRLLQLPQRRHDCYHLSAGIDGAMRCGNVARFIDTYYKRQKPLELIPPHEWTRETHRRYVHTAHQRKIFATLKHYLPFLNMNVVYDNSRLRHELNDNSFQIPPVTDYIGGLLDLLTKVMRADGTLSGERIPA